MPWEVSIAQDFWGNLWAVVALAIFLAVAALVVYWFVRMAFVRPVRFVSEEPRPDPVILALDERYERGEIDREAYLRERAELERQR